MTVISMVTRARLDLQSEMPEMLTEMLAEMPEMPEMLTETLAEMPEMPVRIVTLAVVVPVFFTVAVEHGDTEAALAFATEAVKKGEVIGRYGWDARSAPAVMTCSRKDLGGGLEAIPLKFDACEVWGRVPTPQRSISTQ